VTDWRKYLRKCDLQAYNEVIRIGRAQTGVVQQNMATLYQKLKLFHGLLTREIAFAGPFAVTVDVTRRCNIRCLGCAIHSPYVTGQAPHDTATQDLDVNMFGRLCRELQTMNTNTLVFCGDGEPLLHPRMFDLIQLAHSAGFRTVLLTNGTLLDEIKVRSLVDSRLDLVRVSLWASSPDEFKRNYPGTSADYFTTIINGLHLLASAKNSQRAASPHVALHLVINRHNFQSIDSFVDLAIEMRCDSVSFSPLHTIFDQIASYGLLRQEENLLGEQLLRAKEKLRSLEVEHNIDETIRRYEAGANVWKKVPCYVGWMTCRMKVDGTIQPCNPCQLPMGNFREQSLGEIWNGPVYRAFREMILAPNSSRVMDERCDCSFCCHFSDNLRVHRFYKWMSPLCRVFGKPKTNSEVS